MLALLWILIFDFYMILYSLQIIDLNIVSVIKLSFYQRTSILYKQDLSTCQINWWLRKVNTQYDFLVGQKDILCAKLSNEDVDFTLSKLFWRIPCKEWCALRYLHVFRNWIFDVQLCKQNAGCQRKSNPTVQQGGVKRNGYAFFVMAMLNFHFVHLQSTKWPLPIDNA